MFDSYKLEKNLYPEIEERKNYSGLRSRFRKYIENLYAKIDTKIGDILIIGAAGAVAVAGVFLWAVGGALVGAIAGEILDHTPYLNYAIPKTLEEIFGTSYFYGNLDKLGAAM